MKQLGIFLRANKVLHFILVGVGCKRVQTMGTQVLALCSRVRDTIAKSAAYTSWQYIEPPHNKALKCLQSHL